MPRYRKKRTPLWITLPMWAVILAIVGWGLWQTSEIRRTVLAEAQLGERRLLREQAAGGIRPASPDGGVNPGLAATTPDDDPLVSPVAFKRPTPGIDTALIPELGAGSTADLEMEDDSEWPQAAPIDDTSGFDDLQAHGLKLLDAGRIVDGRALLNAALAKAPDDRRSAALRETLTALNSGILLGPEVLPDDPLARYVEIQSGDTFLKLGRNCGVPPAALLQTLNPSLNPRNLKPLSGVKIVRGPLGLRIFKEAARVDVYAREMYVRSFGLQLPEGNYLPCGTYRVKSDSKIQVGSRAWIGFEGTEAATERVTAGWIYGSGGPRGAGTRDRSSGLRLTDADVNQLYNMVVETRSHVVVEP